MITSYRRELPTPTTINEALTSNKNTKTLTASPDTRTLLWEDGGGNEIRIIQNSEITIIIMYDHESPLNYYPNNADRQPALSEAPEEITDFLELIKDEITWEWDDTDEIWNTAAFWIIKDQEWETSYDWEESHDESSVSWMFNVISDEILE